MTETQIGIAVFLVIYVGLAAISGEIGRRKGYKFGPFFVLSLASLWIVGLVVALTMPPPPQNVYLPGVEGPTCGVCGTKAEAGTPQCPKCGMVFRLAQ